MVVIYIIKHKKSIMKNLIYTTALILGLTSISFAQDTADQNPNYQKSLVKYDLQKDNASVQQGVTIQDTYVMKDWRELKADKKELKAERRHELRKLRMEANAQNRRYNNQYYNNRYNRNCSSYYNY